MSEYGHVDVVHETSEITVSMALTMRGDMLLNVRPVGVPSLVSGLGMLALAADTLREIAAEHGTGPDGLNSEGIPGGPVDHDDDGEPPTMGDTADAWAEVINDPDDAEAVPTWDRLSINTRKQLHRLFVAGYRAGGQR